MTGREIQAWMLLGFAQSEIEWAEHFLEIGCLTSAKRCGGNAALALRDSLALSRRFS